MANININNLSALNMTGADLFNDSESFMTELSDESEQMVMGGCEVCELTAVCVTDSCCHTLQVCLQKTAINGEAFA
ncbi:MAG: hypothetical protein F6J90_38355 [Moorea sp. SIOASIH]|uniref:hypothetical protein n=1 Tax=Moorena sp. SIOASIH TaxID=2607817 RepID=UPI0013B93EBB|nr:hypothetical protein [Moorena sp. SIOASIH]NEO41874.1 hypothetical protein [Moorena sp. SIOASIH]